MSKADIISQRHKDAMKPAVASFFNQTSGIIDINRGRDPLSALGAKEFVQTAYIALKEEGIDVRFFGNLEHICDIMLQALLGNAEPEQQAYISQHKAFYKNALMDALDTFERLELNKRPDSTQNRFDTLFDLLPPYL